MKALDKLNQDWTCFCAEHPLSLTKEDEHRHARKFLCSELDSLRAEVAALKGGDAVAHDHKSTGLVTPPPVGTAGGDGDRLEDAQEARRIGMVFHEYGHGARFDAAELGQLLFRLADHTQAAPVAPKTRACQHLLKMLGSDECASCGAHVPDPRAAPEPATPESPALTLLCEYQAAVVRWGESKVPADYAEVQRLQGELSAVPLGQVRGEEVVKPEAVCKICNDAHQMHFEETGTDRLCTHCPTPCQNCRAGGDGPYCETTPCPCDCHKKQPAKEEEFRAGLPAMALLKAHPEWQYWHTDGGPKRVEGLHIHADGTYTGDGWQERIHLDLIDSSRWDRFRFRPHDKTWAEVERMAAERLGADDAKAGRRRKDVTDLRGLIPGAGAAEKHAYDDAYAAAKGPQ